MPNRHNILDTYLPSGVSVLGVVTEEREATVTVEELGLFLSPITRVDGRLETESDVNICPIADRRVRVVVELPSNAAAKVPVATT